MLRLRGDDPLAISFRTAIRNGDLSSLSALLGKHRALASATIGEGAKSRTALHVATDWPGHFPNGAAIVVVLIDAGADPNARREGARYPETPLHWLASSDDVEVFEVLIKAGADIEASGGSIGGGTPLDNAVGYGQWQVARRLIECGARSKLWHVAALGLMPDVEAFFATGPPPHSSAHIVPDHRGFLSSLRRRSARDCEVSPRPWRRHQLGSPLGQGNRPGSRSETRPEDQRPNTS